MAEYHVAKNGNDANPGTLAQPKLTVAAALNLTTHGDTVWIHKGVYTDAWPRTKVYGRDIRAYNDEDVTIDCEGLRAHVSDGLLNGNSVNSGTLGLRLIGIKFVNYTAEAFVGEQGPSVFVEVLVEFVRCFGRPLQVLGSKFYDGIGMGLVAYRIENCTFKDHGLVFRQIQANQVEYIRNCIFHGNTLIYDPTDFGTEQFDNQAWLPGQKEYNAYPGASSEPGHVNLTTTPVDFNNPGIGDYSLAPTSALRGVGRNIEDIGSPFNPVIRVDGEFSLNALSAGVNDENYYNTTLMQPGPDGPPDAGPAVFSSGIWKINNVLVPGAKSSRVKFGPFNTLPGTKVRMPGWKGLQDLVPASGSRQVIDFTGGTGTRDMQVQINGGALQTAARSTNLNQNASDVAYYMTLRADGV